MDADWKKLPVPLGLVAAAIVALCVTWSYADDRYLLASDYRQDRLFDQQLQYSKEYRSLNAEVKELEAKKHYAPQHFDGVDKARLDIKRKQLQEVEQQMKAIEKQQRR